MVVLVTTVARRATSPGSALSLARSSAATAMRRVISPRIARSPLTVSYPAGFVELKTLTHVPQQSPASSATTAARWVTRVTSAPTLPRRTSMTSAPPTPPPTTSIPVMPGVPAVALPRTLALAVGRCVPRDAPAKGLVW